MRNARLDNVVAFVGRKNSGKTTLVEQLIARLHAQGLRVSSVKHHGHCGFDIDVPGKDSYRHHEAGTCATAIVSPDRRACIEELACEENGSDLSEEQNWECLETIGLLPASNLVLVEGFKQVGLPSVELFRADNPRDLQAVPRFLARLQNESPSSVGSYSPNGLPVAIVSDIEEVMMAASCHGIPCFDFLDIDELAQWLKEKFAKPLCSIVIQAGGESKRMGTSKALIPFHGRPLIEHMIDRLHYLAADLVITTNEIEKLAYLQARYPGLRLVSDKFETRGALPGFITALEAARCRYVTVVACDMVNASPELIAREALLLTNSQEIGKKPFDAVVPRTDHGYEPFCATYLKEPCLKAALACWDKGEDRMQRLLDDLAVWPLMPTSCGGHSASLFANANSPSELRTLEMNSLE